MKKSYLFLLIVSITFQFTSCKSEVTKTNATTSKFSIEKATKTVNWTAYKTTDKIAVKGTFKKVNITKNGNGNTVKEAINNTTFSIPVSSIFSANEERDSKLVKFFFGAMAETELMSGSLSISTDSTGIASLTLNSTTQNLPFTYSIDNKTVAINAIMHLDQWNAQNAIDSLNVACKELHKAADGISKTWNDVAIDITIKFE